MFRVPLVKCQDCQFFRIHANGETGDCTLVLPPFMVDEQKGTWTDKFSGCDLGLPKDSQLRTSYIHLVPTQGERVSIN